MYRCGVVQCVTAALTTLCVQLYLYDIIAGTRRLSDVCNEDDDGGVSQCQWRCQWCDGAMGLR
jgi:hypothetical protein